MIRTTTICSKGLAIYFLVLPVLFYGIHVHQFHTNTKQPHFNKENQTAVSQELKHCSLCDLYLNVAAVFDAFHICLVSPVTEESPIRFLDPGIFSPSIIVAQRGPPRIIS